MYRAKNTRSDPNWADFKTLLRNLKKEFRKKTKRNMGSLCEETEDYTEISKLCRIISKNNNHELNFLVKKDHLKV